MNPGTALSSPNPMPTDEQLRLSLTLPMTRFGLGGLTLDPVAAFLGAPLSTLLGQALARPVTQRPAAGGGMLEVYPLAIPAGLGFALNLGFMGHLGLFNDRGLLRLTAPIPLLPWLNQAFGPALVHGPQLLAATPGGAPVAWLWIRVSPALQARIPLGTYSELGVEGV